MNFKLKEQVSRSDAGCGTTPIRLHLSLAHFAANLVPLSVQSWRTWLQNRRQIELLLYLRSHTRYSRFANRTSLGRWLIPASRRQ
jgi:hypothetical protein